MSPIVYASNSFGNRELPAFEQVRRVEDIVAFLVKEEPSGKYRCAKLPPAVAMLRSA